MTALEFQPWPKIARLHRDITVTEKIDGTNAAVVIVPLSDGDIISGEPITTLQIDSGLVGGIEADFDTFAVYAQSRTRFITPKSDNYGFAGWVERNAEALVETLGAGTHFGEWWGSGIQRGYGLTGGDKRFSLFNTKRWNLALGDDGAHIDAGIPGLGVVPILYEGLFDQACIDEQVDYLRGSGSVAAPGFMRPEGIVIWHDAARQSFKVTLEGDEAPKGAAAHARDEERAA